MEMRWQEEAGHGDEVAGGGWGWRGWSRWELCRLPAPGDRAMCGLGFPEAMQCHCV